MFLDRLLRAMLPKRKSPSPKRKSPSPKRSVRRTSPSVKRSGAIGANWYGSRNYISSTGPLMRMTVRR